MKRMTTLWFALACLLSAGSVEPGRAAEPAVPAAGEALAPLAWLAGSCWTGIFADGKTRDHVCYDWVFDRKFLRSRHRVVGDAQPYAGESWISYDKKSGGIHYDYFNSLGDVLRGAVVPDADGVAFPAEPVTIEGQPAEIRSAWRRKGADAYAAVTERRYGEEWRPLFTIEFVRDATQEWREILDSTFWREPGGAAPAPDDFR